jgi:hypothetical protein
MAGKHSFWPSKRRDFDAGCNDVEKVFELFSSWCVFSLWRQPAGCNLLVRELPSFQMLDIRV